jgi:hypothetical protein
MICSTINGINMSWNIRRMRRFQKRLKIKGNEKRKTQKIQELKQGLHNEEEECWCRRERNDNEHIKKKKKLKKKDQQADVKPRLRCKEKKSHWRKVKRLKEKTLQEVKLSWYFYGNSTEDLQYPHWKRDVDAKPHKKCRQESIFQVSKHMLKGKKKPGSR